MVEWLTLLLQWLGLLNRNFPLLKRLAFQVRRSSGFAHQGALETGAAVLNP